jgi:hypothetical protein
VSLDLVFFRPPILCISSSSILGRRRHCGQRSSFFTPLRQKNEPGRLWQFGQRSALVLMYRTGPNIPFGGIHEINTSRHTVTPPNESWRQSYVIVPWRRRHQLKVPSTASTGPIFCICKIQRQMMVMHLQHAQPQNIRGFNDSRNGSAHLISAGQGCGHMAALPTTRDSGGDTQVDRNRSRHRW